MGDTQVSLSFLHWQELYEREKPFQIFTNIPEDAEDQRDSNLVFKRETVLIRDIRGLSEMFSLDTNGFIYRRHTLKNIDSYDRKSIEQNYLPKIEKLLRQAVEGIDQVFFFDWRVSERYLDSYPCYVSDDISFGKMRLRSKARLLI